MLTGVVHPYSPDALSGAVEATAAGLVLLVLSGPRESIETTMGFAGVSGLPMVTRSGDCPPDQRFYLLRTKQFDDASLEKMLYEHSGLLGLSGISGDMRALQASALPEPLSDGRFASSETYVSHSGQFIPLPH